MNWDEIKQRIGVQVRAAREAVEITQEELAAKAEISADAISLLERGKTLPRLRTLLLISNELSIDLAPLLAMPSGRKSAKRLRLEAEITELLKGISDVRLESVRDQVAILARLR